MESAAAAAVPATDIAKDASSGPGSFTPITAATPPPTKPAGADGVSVFGGFLVSNERDRRLVGREKWVTYDNQTLNIAIIASAINVWCALGGSSKWSAVPNKRGGKDAQRGADIVTEGLFEAQLSTPWAQTVRRQLMKKFRGFALHEMTIRRRSDGMVVVADLLDRPQWTVNRWDKADEQSAWIGVEQMTRMGATPYIPRERLFYSVENTLSPSPEGVGILRQTAEPVRVLELYQQWEGIGFQTDLRGMPIGRAPTSKLLADATINGAKTVDEQISYVQRNVKFLSDFLSGHNKTPDQGILLDSATYLSKDAAQSPSAIYEWAFDLVKGASSSMPEVGAAIGRIVADIARIMCAEFLLLGGAGAGGAYSMHADKTAMFGLLVNGGLGDIAADAKRDIATRLIALNGLDPETCTPDLVPEPVATAAVTTACQALMQMAQAALDPRDPAINILRARLDLPPAPEVDETMLMLPRGMTVDPVGADGKPVPAAGTEAAPTAAAPGKAGNVQARPDPGIKKADIEDSRQALALHDTLVDLNRTQGETIGNLIGLRLGVAHARLAKARPASLDAASAPSLYAALEHLHQVQSDALASLAALRSAR